MPTDEFAESVARLHAASPMGKRLRVTAAVTLHPESARHGDDGVVHPLAEAVSLWEAGADTVIVHPLAFCDSTEELGTFLHPLLEARAG